MDKSQNLMDIDNVDELKEAIKNLLKEVSKFHPNYPVYGYDYVNGKLISIVREPHDYL